jgi:hypothetical protein
MIEERIIIRAGADTFDVVVGHRLNDRPLTRAEADRLAHVPAEAAAPPAPEPAKVPVRAKASAPELAPPLDEPSSAHRSLILA